MTATKSTLVWASLALWTTTSLQAVSAFTAPSTKTPVHAPLRSRNDQSILKATVEDQEATSTAATSTYQDRVAQNLPPFSTIMAANRAEIAVRIMRAATELNAGTVAIYANEDRYGQHRWGADKSYELQKETDLSTPISTYLDIEQIIDIAKKVCAEKRYGNNRNSTKNGFGWTKSYLVTTERLT